MAVRLGWPPLWRWFITSIAMQTVTILDNRSTDKQVMFTLNAPAVHTGQVASDDVEVNIPFPAPGDQANLSNNSRLCFGLRYESGVYVPRFSGIVMQCEDQGEDAPTTRYTAYDPWQYMFNRPVRKNDFSLPDEEGITYYPEDGATCSQIAVDLLTSTEAVDGETYIDFSDAGLIADSQVITNTINIPAGASVGEAWQQLCDTGDIDIWLEPIYDVTNVPKIAKLHIYVYKGSVKFDAVMGWDMGGNSIMSINRLVDGTRLANVTQFFAGQGGVPVPLQGDSASIALYGQYWAQQFFPGSQQSDLVALAAYADLLIRRNGQRTIAFDPTPEATVLSLRDYNLGDYLPVWASQNLREPIGVDYAAYVADPEFPGAAGFMRCYAIPLEIDDNGVERVRGLIASKETGFGS